MASGDMTGAALYRTIWRWHFYAGLYVIPFLLMLATTGLAATKYRSQAPGRRGNRTAIVGRERAMFQRHLAGAPAVAVARPREVVGVEVVATPAGVGPGVTKRGDRDHHQRRCRAEDDREDRAGAALSGDRDKRTTA